MRFWGVFHLPEVPYLPQVLSWDGVGEVWGEEGGMEEARGNHGLAAIDPAILIDLGFCTQA